MIIPNSYLIVTHTNRPKENALARLQMLWWCENRLMDMVDAVSGIPGRQNFRTGADSKSGSLEPLPEGAYRVGKPRAPFVRSRAVGDVVIDLEPLFSTARSGILIHLDANKERSPGTAGCLGLLSQDDMDRVLMWFDQNSPTRCYVDYGLGTVELPGVASNA